jgi:hypothetical protein
LDAILTVHDVEAKRKRIDDTRREPTFFFHLARGPRDFPCQAMDVFGVRQFRRQKIRNDVSTSSASVVIVVAFDGKDADLLLHANESPGQQSWRRPHSINRVTHITDRDRWRSAIADRRRPVLREPQAHFACNQGALEALDHIPTVATISRLPRAACNLDSTASGPRGVAAVR